MVIGTHKSNATKHPGKLLTDSKQWRWSKAQIEEDKTHTKAAAAAAKEEENTKCWAILTSVMDIEDFMERHEKALWAYANQPDLCNSLKYPVAEKSIDLLWVPAIGIP